MLAQLSVDKTAGQYNSFTIVPSSNGTVWLSLDHTHTQPSTHKAQYTEAQYYMIYSQH